MSEMTTERQQDLYNALIAYRDDSAKRLSDQVRALALGTIAFTWIVLSDDKLLIGKSIAARHIHWLLLIDLLAVLTLAVDLLHSFVYQRIIQRKLNSGKDTSNPEYSSRGYRFLELSPWVRTGLCLLACALLLILVAKAALFELNVKCS